MASLIRTCNIFKLRSSNFLSVFASKDVRSRCYSKDVLQGKTVRIGCSSGFWGDTSVAAPQLIHKGNIDFLVADYLSEITMSLLSAAKMKNPNLGYAPDFVEAVMAPFVKDVKRKGIRVVTNAGGINPMGCAEALRKVASKAGVDLKIAVVTGDDLLSQKDELAGKVREMNTGERLPSSVTSMTAYLGAGAISQALDGGADVVLTGRCVDSALALGPLLHTFKWRMDDYDKLAAGSLAGHLIECGAQVTGGIFTDWHKVPDWHNIGFPIAECDSSGSFVVTKPPGTGGVVNLATVSEQLVYEIGDPSKYILPDVICDFTKTNLKQLPEADSVLVSGVKGRPHTGTYKVCTTYADGYRLNIVTTLGGRRAAEKGRRTAEAILSRARGIFKILDLPDFEKTHLQIIGAEDTYGKHAMGGDGPRDAVIWLAVQHKDKRALHLLAREIAGAGTGMAPGLTGIVGGRPKISPILKLFSFLYPKENVKIKIHMSEEEEYVAPSGGQKEPEMTPESLEGKEINLPTGDFCYRLEDLAYTRSGDKGNHCNIGVVARHPSYLPYLRQALTPASVDRYMEHVFDDRSGSPEDRVLRYDIPGIHAMNFMLLNSLGGGGISSLRSDPQGKAYGQMLLGFEINNVPDLEALAQAEDNLTQRQE